MTDSANRPDDTTPTADHRPDAVEGGGPAPATLVLHVSITPRGGWHRHAVALTEALADQPNQRHLLLHWPGAATPRRAVPTAEIGRTWLGRRATASMVALPQVAALAARHRVDWVHVHGLPSEPFGLVLALALKAVLRPSGAAMATTPHNAFGRRGPIEFRRLRRATLRLFDRVFVFAEDQRRWGGPRSVVAPFLLATGPAPDPGSTHRPTDRGLAPGRRVVCLPGQIRADKGFHLVPAALAGQDYAIRIAGPDRGGYAQLLSAARRHGVPLLGQPGFAEEGEFQAAIADADVVVLPYRRVTQSGVLAYARAAGTPVAGSTAMRTAGLAADAYFDPDDPHSLRAAVVEAAEGPRPDGPWGREAPTAHLYAPPADRARRRRGRR